MKEVNVFSEMLYIDFNVSETPRIAEQIRKRCKMYAPTGRGADPWN